LAQAKSVLVKVQIIKWYRWSWGSACCWPNSISLWRYSQ